MATSPPTGIEELPLEILSEICEAVSRTYWPSVASFSLVSKQCWRVARPILHRRIKFADLDPKSLLRNTARWSKVLSEADGYSHVHEVYISRPRNPGPLNEHEDEDWEAWHYSECEAWRYGEEDVSQQWQRVWTAMAKFLKRLRCLRDLEYDSKAPFPGELLSVLHSEDRAACRLHIKQFHLPSLVGTAYYWKWHETEADNVGDFELSEADRMLALSPCLHSVSLDVSLGRGTGVRSFNLKAVQQLVQGANPHVKVVDVYNTRAPRIKGEPARHPRFHRTWHGFGSSSQSPSNLISLRLGDSWGGLHLEKFEAWHASFATLRVLKLCLSVDLAVLRRIAEQKEDSPLFPSLTYFELATSRPWRENTREVALVIQQVLRSLPPLETLSLPGYFCNLSPRQRASIFDLVLDCHGHTLTSLSPPQTLSSSDVRQLIYRCPQLQHLSTIVARTGGGADEVAMYRQLGSHPRLQSIALTLDCTVDACRTYPSSRGGWYDYNVLFPFPSSAHPSEGRTQRAKQVSFSHVRTSLTKCALDGPLAEAIFRHIQAAKPVGASSLQRLFVGLSNTGEFRFSRTANHEHRPFDPVMQYFARRAWTVIPHPSDARPLEVIATFGARGSVYQAAECGKLCLPLPSSWSAGTDGRRAWTMIPLLSDARPGEVITNFGKHLDSDESAIQLGNWEMAFRSLWPEGATEDWRDDWHSLPLVE
jgi:hypothetical protein